MNSRDSINFKISTYIKSQVIKVEEQQAGHLTGNRFKGMFNFKHARKAGMGVLVVNLGTPDEPTTSAVSHYLAEFLPDGRAVEISRLIWMLILHRIILRIRPTKSAAAYKKVWSEQGSPLMAGTADLTSKQMHLRGLN